MKDVVGVAVVVDVSVRGYSHVRIHQPTALLATSVSYECCTCLYDACSIVPARSAMLHLDTGCWIGHVAIAT